MQERELKVPDALQVTLPPPLYPLSHLTATDWPVVPAMEFFSEWSLLGTCVDAQAFASQVASLHFPRRHLAGPDGSYPLEQENMKADPLSVPDPPASPFSVEKSSWHDFGLHVGESHLPRLHVATSDGTNPSLHSKVKDCPLFVPFPPGTLFSVVNVFEQASGSHVGESHCPNVQVATAEAE
jgi:hypothetical protein